MLTKGDLQAIGRVVNSQIKTALDEFGKVVDRKIKSALDEKLPEAFGDFMEQVLGPYLEEHVEKRFDR